MIIYPPGEPRGHSSTVVHTRDTKDPMLHAPVVQIVLPVCSASIQLLLTHGQHVAMLPLARGVACLLHRSTAHPRAHPIPSPPSSQDACAPDYCDELNCVDPASATSTLRRVNSPPMHLAVSRSCTTLCPGSDKLEACLPSPIRCFSCCCETSNQLPRHELHLCRKCIWFICSERQDVQDSQVANVPLSR